MSIEEHNYSSSSPVSPRPSSLSPHPHCPHIPPPPPFRVPVPLSSPQSSFQSVPPAWGKHGQSSPTGQWGNSSSCGVKSMGTNLSALYQYVPATPTPQMELHSQSKHLGVPSTSSQGPLDPAASWEGWVTVPRVAVWGSEPSPSAGPGNFHLLFAWGVCRSCPGSPGPEGWSAGPWR